MLENEIKNVIITTINPHTNTSMSGVKQGTNIYII